MFGFQGGESRETVARKRGYMTDAQQRWSFITLYDMSTIKNDAQLQQMVKVRLGLSEADAWKDVRDWIKGKDFTSNPQPSASESIGRWDSEGGAADKR